MDGYQPKDDGLDLLDPPGHEEKTTIENELGLTDEMIARQVSKFCAGNFYKHQTEKLSVKWLIEYLVLPAHDDGYARDDMYKAVLNALKEREENLKKE